MAKEWDVFISHASEDKRAVALPLEQALRKIGLKVWLDQHESSLGDSLREHPRGPGEEPLRGGDPEPGVLRKSNGRWTNFGR